MTGWTGAGQAHHGKPPPPTHGICCPVAARLTCHPSSPEDRFSGNGGLSLRKVSAIRRILSFQARYNDSEPEDEWFGKRLWVLPGEKVASGTTGALAVEDVYVESPMGYHIRDGGSNLNDDVWKDHKQRKKILDYCPELSLIMNMKLERERCEGDQRDGVIHPTEEEKEAERLKLEEERRKQEEEEQQKKLEEEAKERAAAASASAASAASAASVSRTAHTVAVTETAAVAEAVAPAEGAPAKGAPEQKEEATQTKSPAETEVLLTAPSTATAIDDGEPPSPTSLLEWDETLQGLGDKR